MANSGATKNLRPSEFLRLHLRTMVAKEIRRFCFGQSDVFRQNRGIFELTRSREDCGISRTDRNRKSAKTVKDPGRPEDVWTGARFAWLMLPPMRSAPTGRRGVRHGSSGLVKEGGWSRTMRWMDSTGTDRPGVVRWTEWMMRCG
jgi:hypothetical protein